MCCGAAAKGYETLLNTNLGQELDQLGRFLNLVVEHKHRIGFKGTILIEPKPREPSKHQYDFDVATVYGFLKRYGLEKEVKVNIEANHATLAGPQLRARDRAGRRRWACSAQSTPTAATRNWAGTPTSSPTIRAEMALAFYVILKARRAGQRRP
jgi:xylose isomerase